MSRKKACSSAFWTEGGALLHDAPASEDESTVSPPSREDRFFLDEVRLLQSAKDLDRDLLGDLLLDLPGEPFFFLFSFFADFCSTLDAFAGFCSTWGGGLRTALFEAFLGFAEGYMVAASPAISY